MSKWRHSMTSSSDISKRCHLVTSPDVTKWFHPMTSSKCNDVTRRCHDVTQRCHVQWPRRAKMWCERRQLFGVKKLKLSTLWAKKLTPSIFGQKVYVVNTQPKSWCCQFSAKKLMPSIFGQKLTAHAKWYLSQVGCHFWHFILQANA